MFPKLPRPDLRNCGVFTTGKAEKAIADVITLFDEVIDDTRPYEIFDPNFVWKRKVLTNFRAEDIRVQLFRNGRPVAKKKSLKEIQDFCRQQVDTLWDEVKRFENPHRYYVDLSQKLWDLKNRMISKYSFGSNT
jgi:nicotinate phosphoribosyltransferase